MSTPTSSTLPDCLYCGAKSYISWRGLEYDCGNLQIFGDTTTLHQSAACLARELAAVKAHVARLRGVLENIAAGVERPGALSDLEMAAIAKSTLASTPSDSLAAVREARAALREYEDQMKQCREAFNRHDWGTGQLSAVLGAHEGVVAKLTTIFGDGKEGE